MFKCEDDMVECPYNKSHLMLRKRLQSHLLKCRRHYPDVELMKCPFNATHLVPEPEFTHHVTNCPDRKLITQYKYDAPEPKEEEEEPKHAPVESEENWDDTDVPDYDPTKYIEKATIIRLPAGPTPSERKEFIKKERQRLGDPVSDDEEEDEVNFIEEVPVVQEDRRDSQPFRERSRSPLSRLQYVRRSPAPSGSYNRHSNVSPPLNRGERDHNRSFEKGHSRDSRSERFEGERERSKYYNKDDRYPRDRYSKPYFIHSETKNSSSDYRSSKRSYNNRSD